MLLRRTTRGVSRYCSTICSSSTKDERLALTLADISRQKGMVQTLILSASRDIQCSNLMCEHVGNPCLCRLSLALERVSSSLETLDLSRNHLTSFPQSLWQLDHLQHLNLSHNALSRLGHRPQEFAGLPALMSLDVSYNQFQSLEELDDHMKRWPKLIQVNLMGNPVLQHVSSIGLEKFKQAHRDIEFITTESE